MRLTQLIPSITLLATCLAYTPLGSAATSGASRWVVILSEKPVAQQYPGRIEKIRAAAEPYRQHLRQTQASLRPRIEATHARVTGSVQHLLNGIFVVATPSQAAALRNLPGVKAVMHIRQYHKMAQDQLALSNVATAWSAAGVGGESNAGAGIKIGIIDTGIDQTHPAFQDSSLVAPAGFPVCDVPPTDCPNLPSNCAYTSNKVIVARSYVCEIVFADVPASATDTASASRPDDLSARDLDGHGTAVASVAAGVTTTYNGTQITGVAPKAFLGNYKVFGSDDVNPNGSGNILQALEDAVTDGMDVVNLSLGSPGYAGPLDEDPTNCVSSSLPSGNIPIPGDACDPFAYEVESAMQNALVTVVVAAGNQGADGYQFNYGCSSPPCYNLPTFGTVGSPAYAPSAIAVGGIQNGVTYVQQVQVSGLQTIDGFTSYDGPEPSNPVSAPLVDDTSPCTASSPTSFTGQFVLVTQGACNDVDLVTNAQNAGAVGVIEVANAASFFLPFGLSGTSIPTFIIGQGDGATLKSFVDAHPGAKTTLDPRPYQVPASSVGLAPYSLAPFSARGPVIETGALKPDLVAAATDFLIPAENYDPYGALFNFSRYGVTQGTSFSTPMVTGSAALVKQALGLPPLQIKSALVNTASASNLVTSDNTNQASVSEVGAGLLQTQNAVQSTVQVVPSTISFGTVGVNITTPMTLTFYNTASASVSLTMTVVPDANHTNTVDQVQVNSASTATLSVPGSNSATASVSLTGGTPPAGRYEGVITVTGGPVALSIPYMYVEGDGVPYDVIPLNAVQPGQGFTAFDGAVGAQIPWLQACPTSINSCVSDYGPIAVEVVDQFGVPVANAPISWAVTQGNGSIVQGTNYTDTVTNANGIAGATVNLDSAAGSQEFTATVSGMALPFDGYARVVPAINSGGIVDGASYKVTAVAPGSWISVFGTNLTDETQGDSGTNVAFATCSSCNPASGQPFPMGIDGAAFSFDTTSQTLPGRFSFVSPTQLNIQVPWELQGETSATVKSIVNYTYSGESTLQIAQYSPSFFTYNYTPEVAALDTNYKVITPSNPIARGAAVQLFMNGLGPVDTPQVDGVGPPLSPLVNTQATPTITIGGQPAQVLFHGLAPLYVGLYQVNVVVPSGISTGAQPITCTIGGVTSATGYTLAVQ